MKNIIFLICLFLSSGIALGQNKFKMEFHTGYATYSMGSAKRWQLDLAEKSGLPLKVTDNYPSFAYTQLTGIFVVKSKLFVGVSLGTNSTAGRLSYADYSGTAVIDQLANAITVAFLAELQVLEKGNSEVFFRPRVGIRESRLALKSSVMLGDVALINKTEKFVSSNALMGLALGYRYNIGRIYLGFEGGFDVERGNKLIFKDKTDTYLVDSQDKQVVLNWSGMRAGLTVGVKIK